MDELSCYAVMKSAILKRSEGGKNGLKTYLENIIFFPLMSGLGAAELDPFNNCFLTIYCL